jgi:general secretion pathway protein K
MKRRQRGFALLIVLWTVGLLALLGTQIVAAGRSDTQLTGNLRQEAVLAAAADGAVFNIVFRLQAARDPSLKADGMVRMLRIGATPVLFRIEAESDRINLNTASASLLRALIVEVGAPPAQANRLAAAILDWRTSGGRARPGGAKAPEYQAAGKSYGPPGMAFRNVPELADVLGMTPDLYVRLEPHLTVLTDGDPDMATRDPVVARALMDAAGVADDLDATPQAADALLRISVTALGRDAARYARVVVAYLDLQDSPASVKVLWQDRAIPLIAESPPPRDPQS